MAGPVKAIDHGDDRADIHVAHPGDLRLRQREGLDRAVGSDTRPAKSAPVIPSLASTGGPVKPDPLTPRVLARVSCNPPTVAMICLPVVPPAVGIRDGRLVSITGEGKERIPDRGAARRDRPRKAVEHGVTSIVSVGDPVLKVCQRVVKGGEELISESLVGRVAKYRVWVRRCR